MRWIDERLPLPRLVYGAVGGGYPVPRNLNYWWNFGVLAGLFLTIQIVTGIVLAMWYYSSADGAFNSVEHIMRDVNAGWAIRYAHMNGASFFFIVTYIHIFRGLYYGSYKAPRELVWMLGLVIYLLMMATAFMGYVLPWGQMSYWGAQVITGFFSAFPLVGEPIRIWLLGGYAPDQAALTRFFSLHYLLPFVIAAVVILHIWALHIPGSGNPTGVDVKDEKDTLAVPSVLHGEGRLGRRGVPDRVRVRRLFRAELPRPPGQLHSGEPAGDARAHRARMVFLAVLRDPSRLHRRLHPAGQAVGRAGDVQLDPDPVLPAVARPVAGPLGHLSAGVQAFLLAAGRGHLRPRLVRRRGGDADLRRGQPAGGGLLFRALPHHPAAGVGVRDGRLPLPNSISSSRLHGEKKEAAPAGISPRRGATAIAE